MMGVTLGRADLELRGRLDAVPVTSRASDLDIGLEFRRFDGDEPAERDLRIRAFVRYSTVRCCHSIDRRRIQRSAAQLSECQRADQ